MPIYTIYICNIRKMTKLIHPSRFDFFFLTSTKIVLLVSLVVFPVILLIKNYFITIIIYSFYQSLL